MSLFVGACKNNHACMSMEKAKSKQIKFPGNKDNKKVSPITAH